MRFLVAYDETDGAEAALSEAAALAREARGQVVLLQVLNALIDAADVMAPTTQAAIAVVQQEREAALSSRVADLGVETFVRVEILEHGEDPWERIVAAAGETDVALVAIGSRRAGGLVGALLGSVTRAVVQHSSRPVLVVKP